MTPRRRTRATLVSRFLSVADVKTIGLLATTLFGAWTLNHKQEGQAQEGRENMAVVVSVAAQALARSDSAVVELRKVKRELRHVKRQLGIRRSQRGHDVYDGTPDAFEPDGPPAPQPNGWVALWHKINPFRRR